MKLLLYIVGGFVAMGASALLITRGQAPERQPALLIGFVALFGIPPLGAFWMMYMSIPHEKNPFPMVLLAFIPFTFLWYYFERVRSGQIAKRRDSA